MTQAFHAGLCFAVQTENINNNPATVRWTTVFVITIHYFCFELQIINSQNFHHFITMMPVHSKTIRIASDVSFSFELQINIFALCFNYFPQVYIPL
jgi:hypothetical protein